VFLKNVEYVDKRKSMETISAKEKVIYKLASPKCLVVEPSLSAKKGLEKNEIYAKTVYSVISRGTEIAAWLGHPPLRPTKNVYPRLVGYCNMAQIVSIGEKVKSIKTGDYILTHQCHRRDFVCEESDVILTFPESTPNEELKKLTATYLYHLGYVALIKAQYFPGLEVAIIGMGLLGVCTATLIDQFGGSSVCYTGNARRNFPIHMRKNIRDKDRIEEEPLTEAKGADIVINTSDSWSDHYLSMKIVRYGGDVVCLGFPGRQEESTIGNPLASEFFYDKQISLHHCGYVAKKDCPRVENRFTLKRNMEYLASLIQSGKINPSDIINGEYYWTELADAYKNLEKKSGPVGTGLIKWNT
jgi:threonine dehydrogenase-like Zn-dependent dehydrogenase